MAMLLKCCMLFVMPATQADLTTPVCEPFHNRERCAAGSKRSPDERSDIRVSQIFSGPPHIAELMGATR
jgi:hypothetical protein